MSLSRNDHDRWCELPVERSDRELLIGGHQVMQAWERPLMRRLAEAITEHPGDILEVGYGLGISAAEVAARGCRSYTVIESHPEVAEWARDWGHAQPFPVRVVEGRWQDHWQELGKFDGVLFDTYPMTTDERGRNHFPFIPCAPQLLRRPGIFTCYSDETVRFREEHLELLLQNFDEVRLVKVAGLVPFPGTEYWNADHMVIPVARLLPGAKSGS